MKESTIKNLIIIILITIIIANNLNISTILTRHYLLTILTISTLVILICNNRKKTNKDENWVVSEINQQLKQLKQHYKMINYYKNKTTTLILGLDNIGKKSIINNDYQLLTKQHNKISMS